MLTLSDLGARPVERLGVVGLLLFAFSAWLSVSGASVGLALLVLAFLFDHAHWWKVCRRDPIVIAGLFFTIYIVLRAAWASREFPEISAVQWEEVWNWSQLWFFLCVAWWLGGNLKRVNWVSALVLIGLCLGALLHIDENFLSSLLRLQDAERTLFRSHPNVYALYVSCAMLGLLMFAPRFWGDAANRKAFLLRITGWSIVFIFLILWFLSTQTRSAWIAALLVIPPVLLVLLSSWWLKTPLRLRWVGVIPMVLAVLAGAAVLYLNSSVIQNRLMVERTTVTSIIAGDENNIPSTSIGFRFHINQFGWEKWLERPVFGWGPGSVEYLVAKSERPELLHPTFGGKLDWMDHLHNTYLELLVRFGLVGAVLLFAAFGFLVKGLWTAYRTGRLPSDYALFIIGAFAITAIWCLFNFRLNHFDWRYYWLLLAGMTYTFTLNPQADVKH